MRDEPGTDELQLDELPPEYPPERYRLASNRTIMDRETGRIVAHHPAGSTTIINKENSTDYHHYRIKKQLEGLLITDAKLAELAGSAGKAWGEVISRLYTRATDEEEGGIAGIQAAKLLGEASAYLPKEVGGNGGLPASGGRLTMDLSQDVILAIADRLAARRREPENAENDE